MARFTPVQNNSSVVTLENQAVQTGVVKNYPFDKIYGCAEGDFIYVNMEAVQGLKKGMVTLRDIAIVIDISGSMKPHYMNKSVQQMTAQIVDSLAWADDDGIDIYFFANGLVLNETVKNANEIDEVFRKVLSHEKAFRTTMPTECFKVFCEQIKRKNRAGTVLFLTDGVMDDSGKELKEFYKNYLHTQFVTRDKFYCYAIEFGHSASNALDVLNGLYSPEGGPEDLFDLDGYDSLEHIAEVLRQVGGMSAVGSSVRLSASVDNGVIDVVNQDLIEGGLKQIEGEINQIMSFRVRSNQPFVLTIGVAGYDEMKIKVTPDGVDVKTEIL